MVDYEKYIKNIRLFIPPLGVRWQSGLRNHFYPPIHTYPGSNLKMEPFIRRLTYTDAELNVNKANVEQAISRQGPNLLDTRIWWDKK